MSYCIICLESDAIHTLCDICNYRYHTQCLINYIRSTNQVKCPTCRTELELEVKEQPLMQIDNIINIYTNDTNNLMLEENMLAVHHRFIGPFTLAQSDRLNDIYVKIQIYNKYIDRLIFTKNIIVLYGIFLTIASYITLLLYPNQDMLIVVYSSTIIYAIIPKNAVFVNKNQIVILSIIEIILTSTLIAMSILANNIIITIICIFKLTMYMMTPVIFNYYHKKYIEQLQN